MRVTASRRWLLTHCAYWAQDGVPWDDIPTRGMQAGTDMHEGAEAAHNEEGLSADDRVRRKVEALAPILNGLRAQGESWAEIAFAWDPVDDTARVLGVGKGREVYALARPDEMTGTADLVVRTSPASLIVHDWKSAMPWQDVDAGPQLRSLGLFAARALGATHVSTSAGLVNEGDAREVPGPTLDEIQLDAEAGLLADDLAKIHPVFEAVPHPGPWCKRCPAAPQCPATLEAVDALAVTLPATSIVRHRIVGPLASSAEAAFRLRAFDAIDLAIKAGREQLRQWADAHDGIPLPDGTVWEGHDVTQKKPQLDVPGAVQSIVDAGAEGAIDHSTTWAAIGRAINRKDAAALRAKLTQMGAVKESKSRRYEARKRAGEAAE